MTSYIVWTKKLLIVVLTVFTTGVALADEPEMTTTPSDPPLNITTAKPQEPFKDQKELIEQCHTYAQSLMVEKERLRSELDAIKARMEALALQEMEEEEDHSNESHSRSRGIRRASKRSKRRAVCEGGTVSQWACGSQCIYKLKGLCGLSLRAMCHC